MLRGLGPGRRRAGTRTVLEAQHTVAAQGIQLHGGTGFTWEHGAHLYFKRATADSLLFGPVQLLRPHAEETAGVFAPCGGPSGGVAG
ncbi:hypothetical protein GCM10010393_12040 [Streptomyces gobitricini]|uniref:Acyl-CoA dehydrogenase/oxidase C-terminal domain-containing protein n=1 Tax=Streptomyces gobitricini TaxID=68211 RepID=A0ABN3LEL3_9ACTN